MLVHIRSEFAKRKEFCSNKSDCDPYPAALNLQIHTLPEPVPIPTVSFDTLYEVGLYSDGSHSTFCEFRVTQDLS